MAFDVLMHSKPIRVMHVIDKLSVAGSSIHGVARAIEWWIPRFDPQQFQFSVCSLRVPEPAGEILKREGIPVLFLSRGKFDPRTLTSLLALIKREQPHILHLHGFGATNFGRIASSLTGLPNIVHEHAVFPNQPFYQTVADTLLSPLTTRAIAVSSLVKEYMVQYRRIPEDRIEVIFNGVPLESFLSQSGRDSQKTVVADWRTRLGIPATHKVVGTVGRLHPVKGHRYFLEAACQVLRKYPDVTFLIVGDGELRKSLEELAGALDIERCIRFTGYCDDVAAILSIMDLLVIASLCEGGPLTLFEAMAVGCAVVSTNTIGLKKVIEENKTGFLVPPMNPEALAEKILLLLNEPGLCQMMGARAKESVLQFDISKTVERLGKCYEEILRYARTT